ncbi:MAG: hypothetical protein ACRCUX_16100 [Beijerinckiaceae bacterium]
MNGIRFVIPLLLVATAATAQTPLTPAQTEGPYYPVRRPAETDADLTRIGNGPAAKGDVLVLSGAVVDQTGKPIAGTRVEIWQTDHQGIYMHPDESRTAQRDRNFQFYGEARTGADGAFRFTTIFPASYPGRPRHIHAKITPPGGRTLTTQFYFRGDTDLQRDSIIRRLGAAADQVLLTPQRQADGTAAATITIAVAR